MLRYDKIVYVAVLVLGSVAGWCQTSGPENPAKPKPASPFEPYVGKWTSVFEGKPWLLLRLELHLDMLSGALVHPRKIDLNDNGEIKAFGEEQAIETVTEAAVNPDGLLLTVKDTSTQKTVQYLMKLLPPHNDTAELKTIGMEVRPGMAKPKPWRLTRLTGPATK